MRASLGPGPFRLLLDLGTGTGRILELFYDRIERGLGFDTSQAMLAYARAKLSRGGSSRAAVRHGDLYHLALADGVADAVVAQVLHYLGPGGGDRRGGARAGARRAAAHRRLRAA